MPRADAGEDPHRCKRPMASFGLPAAVARPVGKKELEGSEEAKFERTKEWARLKRKKVWDESTVQEWSAVAERARQRKKKDPNYTIHMGRLFGICVQKGAELPDGDKRLSLIHI